MDAIVEPGDSPPTSTPPTDTSAIPSDSPSVPNDSPPTPPGSDVPTSPATGPTAIGPTATGPTATGPFDGAGGAPGLPTMVPDGSGGSAGASTALPPAGSGGDAGSASGSAEADAGGGGGDDPSSTHHFTDWPPGTSPAEVGLKLAELFASQRSDGTKHYKEACAWYGAIQVSALLDDEKLFGQLRARYTSYINTHATLLSGVGHVDENVFGIVPLELSLHDSSPDYLREGVALADHQQRNIDAQIRFAIDDMFMITGLQMQAYRATGEAKYRDLAASTMVRYLERLQRPDGTFHHHEDVLIKWGRGNGWVASGLTELLRELTPEHEHYSAILEGYRAMMSGLLAYQIESGVGAGLWKQVLDYEGGDNWPETSGSAMFANAMVTGVRSGWLDAATYGPVARAAWLGLVSYLEPDGRLRGVSDWMWKGSVADYVARERVTGDNHGQAPLLWTAAALLR